MRALTSCLVVVVASWVASASLGSDPAFADKRKSEPQRIQIKTGHGSTLDMVLHLPREPRGVAVLIAPGQGYHMDLPLIEKSADRLSDAGFHALRFNWGYFAAKGRPSEGLKVEQADLEAAIGWIRKTKGVEKLILAGKSLGSLVVLNRAGEKHDDIEGVALLTLPIHAPQKPKATLGRTQGHRQGRMSGARRSWRCRSARLSPGFVRTSRADQTTAIRRGRTGRAQLSRPGEEGRQDTHGGTSRCSNPRIRAVLRALVGVLMPARTRRVPCDGRRHASQPAGRRPVAVILSATGAGARTS